MNITLKSLFLKYKFQISFTFILLSKVKKSKLDFEAKTIDFLNAKVVLKKILMKSLDNGNIEVLLTSEDGLVSKDIIDDNGSLIYSKNNLYEASLEK